LTFPLCKICLNPACQKIHIVPRCSSFLGIFSPVCAFGLESRAFCGDEDSGRSFAFLGVGLFPCPFTLLLFSTSRRSFTGCYFCLLCLPLVTLLVQASDWKFPSSLCCHFTIYPAPSVLAHDCVNSVALFFLEANPVPPRDIR